MRDYDPTTGRYLQADPLGLVDGASVYGYVKGNPGRWVDPRGLCFEDACVVEGIVIGNGIRYILGILAAGAAVEAAKEAAQDAANTVDCCQAEREALRKAKENNPGSCKAGDAKSTLEYKLQKIEELLKARIAAFLCIADNDPEHKRQINDVQAMVDECKRRLGF